MRVSGVDGKAQGFEVVGIGVLVEGGFDCRAVLRTGGIGDGFVEVDDLAGEVVECAALFVGLFEGGNAVIGGDGEIVNVDGCM